MKDIDLLNAGYRYAWSLSSNQQDAEDLVQDAWCRLIRRYKRQPEKSLLFTTIRNIYIDQYRHNTRFPRVTLEDYHLLSNCADDYSVESSYAESEALHAQLSRLRDKEREALFLSVVEGYTADEIASMTNSARGTVLSLLQRTKAKLRKWLNHEAQPAVNVVPLDTKRRIK